MAIDRRRIYHKRDRLRQLRAFCLAARLGSITEAADHLRLTQPAVSLHIRELEHELEALLFERSGPRIGLTDAGALLYDLAAPLVEEMDALAVDHEERTDDVDTGELRLAASPAIAMYVLPSVAKRFRDRYPGVRLVVKNSYIREAIDLLLANEVEFVLGMRESLPDDDLEYHQIFTYEIVLITPLDHPLAGRTVISAEEAAAYPAVVPAVDGYSTYYGETAAHHLGLDTRVAVEVGGWSNLKLYVEAGFGIAVVPDICVRERDRLSVVPLKEHFPTRSCGLITRRDGFMSQAARRFIRLMDSELPGPSSESRERAGPFPVSSDAL